MISLSLCMIVKNEEDVLGRCLESVKNIFDEIIIVDTGSTDKTKLIANQYTNNVLDFEWIDNFAAARNYAFSKATSEYIMWLDADDILTEQNKNRLLELKNNFDKTIDFLMMKYDVSFDENGNTTMSYYRERIIKNKSEYKWVGHIHEVITPTGKVEYSDITVSHKKLHPSQANRNLKIFEKMVKDNIKFDDRQKFYYARELYYNKKYTKAIKLFNEVISSSSTWVENRINACIDLANSYYAINKPENVLQSLFKSFEFDSPRAEVCIEIGKYFLNTGKYNNAIFWYKLATTMTAHPENGGFCLLDSYNYIPYLNLCVCYDRIGDLQNANMYNELAGKFKPNDKIYLQNKKYFENVANVVKI